MDSTASSLPKIKNNVIIHEKDDMNRENMLNFPLQNIENSGSDLFLFLFIKNQTRGPGAYVLGTAVPLAIFT